MRTIQLAEFRLLLAAGRGMHTVQLGRLRA